MPVCPECKGEKGVKIPSNNPLNVYVTDGPIVYETYTCSTCQGTGEISDLSLAIYRARGGPAPPPPPMKGFA